METKPTAIRIYPGDLSSLVYTSVLAVRSTEVVEVIRLALQRLQIFEDPSLYDLFVGHNRDPKDNWRCLEETECPVLTQESWKRPKEMRFYLRRKDHASMVLLDIVSNYLTPEAGEEEEFADMIQMQDLTEDRILCNLRLRFSKKVIYTYVGSILISINPYYFYSIYNPKYTSRYQGKALGACPPHIFAIADNAYHSMLTDRAPQSVIISGESGAGKTEATKFLLHHMMSLSTKTDEIQSLELITLGTGPVLEAFGNARTVANNNSSRFGKFIMVDFKENGAYFGASIEKYLLEKSRIVSQAPEERNYHVFYYLMAGAESELRSQLKLFDLNQYRYLTQGSSLAPPTAEGIAEYHRLRQSLSMLSFSDEVQIRMFTVLSAILHIGNITFTKDHEEHQTLQIQNMGAIQVVSNLLQVKEETLRLALTTRKSRAGGTDFFITPYRLEEAVATRDSMAKALYSSLFDWIVDQVNDCLASSGARGLHKGSSIGVLDIFGFEVFQKNSLEQFLINLANEQLQSYFNKHIFKLEQAEYGAEGIEWSAVMYVDNQECLDLIGKKPTGLLPLLDEECSFPNADDNSLFQKFERQHKSHPHYHSPQLKLREPAFTIVHYASDVCYNIKGFREKNRDLLRQDVVDVLKTSKMDLVRALIGLPPYAAHRWHMAYLKVRSAFAFRRSGEVHKAKREAPSVQLHLRLRGSIPSVLEGSDRDFIDGFTSSVPSPITPINSHRLRQSPEAFPLELGGRMRRHFGLRTSRSYDLLSDAQTDGGTPNSKQANGRCLADGDWRTQSSYGVSPRFQRKHPPKAPPASSKSRSISTSAYPTAPIGVRPDQQDRQVRQEKPLKLDKPAKQDKQLHKEESRSRLPSISSLQEKLRKRWPRSLRGKESHEKDKLDKPASKYWKSAPRVKGPIEATDSRTLHTLGRHSSARHGPSKTVGAQFQLSLVSLMERLEKTNPYFIRCIKSNGLKAPCQFDNDLVLRQLRYTGMMETIKIRKAGYPVRMSFEDFYEKYQFLMGQRRRDLPAQIEQFLDSLGLQTEDYQIGRTKVFMRESQKQALQAELRDKVLDRIVVIQRWVRAKMLRCRFLHMRRSAITVQSAVRGWLARRQANVLRKRVCNAVLVQAAWRGYLAKKRFIRLKQAAIIMQAHWKGRMARASYALMLRRKEEERKRKEEEERKRLEDELRRLEEEQRHLEEERRRKEAEEDARRLREKEEQERLETLRREEEDRRKAEVSRQSKADSEDANSLPASAAVDISRGNEEDTVNELQVSQDPASSDSEITDVLFQFDTIINELERDSSASEGETENKSDDDDRQVQIGIDQSNGEIQSDQLNGISHAQSHNIAKRESVANLADKFSTDATSTAMPSSSADEGWSKPSSAVELPIKANIKELKQQFLTPSPSKSQSRSPSPGKDTETLSKSGNVRNLIAQMQTTRQSQTPPPPSISAAEPQEGDDTPTVVRRQRERSPSIYKRITQITHELEEMEKRQSKSYTPPVVIKKIQSPFFSQAVEANMATPARPVSKRMSLASARDSRVTEPESHVTEPESHMTIAEGHVTDPESHVTEPESHVTIAEGHVTRPESHVTIAESQVTEPESHVTEPESEGSVMKSETEHETHTHKPPVSVSGAATGEAKTKPVVEDESSEAPSSEKRALPELRRSVAKEPLPVTDVKQPVAEPPEPERPPVDLTAAAEIVEPIAIIEPASEEAKHIREEKPKLELQLSKLSLPEASEVYYRVRAISDVSERTRVKRADFPQGRKESSGSGDGSLEQTTSTEVVTRDHLMVSDSAGRRKRTAVSIADPMDIVGNMEYVRPVANLEESSELTRCLSPEEIYRLNRQRRLPAPTERLRLFSFTKRRLKLPFRPWSKKHQDSVSLSRSTSKEGKHSKKSPSPTVSFSAVNQEKKSEVNKRHPKLPTAEHRLLPHNFKPIPAAKFSSCELCHKGFSGFMKQAVKCIDCDLIVHRYCEDRAPPCKAQIESGNYVTMSRKKVVKSLEDLDDLGKFLLEKISLMNTDSAPASLLDRVFTMSLHDFHASLVTSYSLSVQGSVESKEGGPASPEEPKITITFGQLVNNFSNIFRGIAKRERLNDTSYITIGINQIKTFVDEFTKARRRISMVRQYSSPIKPTTLRRKTISGRDIEIKQHKGHRFIAQQFKVRTVCEYCSDPIPLLEKGEVCEVCGYTCHEDCFQKTSKKCEGRGRGRSAQAAAKHVQMSSQFGVPLQQLVPENVIKVPAVLEKCLQYIEAHGLYTQGVYRKSAGVSSKKAVRAALEEDPVGADLEGFSLHAVVSAVGAFFRELPEPLLTRELYVEFIRAIDLTDPEERLETLHHLISKLPEMNHAVFERLIFHLARVAQQEHINKMGPSNLAIIFAPCVLQGSVDTRNPQEVLKDLAKQTDCLEIIIMEQMEKLNATLRGIETLTSVARDTATKLTQLSTKEKSEQLAAPPKPADKPAATKDIAAPPEVSEVTEVTEVSEIEGLVERANERRRLADELEEIERERVELTVNLPKLEPFLTNSDEKEKWNFSSSPTIQPKPSRKGRCHTPIMESPSPILMSPASFSMGVHGSQEERTFEGIAFRVPTPPELDTLPNLPSSPTLPALTKNRVSRPPSRRLPSRKFRRSSARTVSIPSES